MKEKKRNNLKTNNMNKVITDKNKINEILERGVEQIFPDKKSLEKLLLSGKKIRLYNGIDPTGPTLHLGHLVQILKLKQFQDLGHEVIVLIGDFTAQIGDPTDKAATRKKLTHKEVIKNCQGYKEQIGKILDLKKTIFKYNSSWLAKLSFADTLELSAYFTAQQTLARDMFKKRIQAGKDLFLHEFLYPLMQAYDSVFMDVDLEIGGNDQMFNMLAGRTLMKKMKSKEKYVMTTKLLEDSTGKKMGKTEGNMVGLNNSPEETFGKIMSWSDEFISIGFELCTQISLKEAEEIKKKLKDQKTNPRDLKMKLAFEIAKLVHGEARAKEAESYFIKTVQKKEAPDQIKNYKLQITNINVVDLFLKAGLVSSKGEARRLIEQGGIKVNGKAVKDSGKEIKLNKKGILLQRGKRQFVKVASK